MKLWSLLLPSRVARIALQNKSPKMAAMGTRCLWTVCHVSTSGESGLTVHDRLQTRSFVLKRNQCLFFSEKKTSCSAGWYVDRITFRSPITCKHSKASPYLPRMGYSSYKTPWSRTPVSTRYKTDLLKGERVCVQNRSPLRSLL